MEFWKAEIEICFHTLRRNKFWDISERDSVILPCNTEGFAYASRQLEARQKKYFKPDLELTTTAATLKSEDIPYKEEVLAMQKKKKI